MKPAALYPRSFGGRQRATAAKRRPIDARVVVTLAATIGILILYASDRAYGTDSSPSRFKKSKPAAVFGPLVAFTECVNKSHIALTFDGALKAL